MADVEKLFSGENGLSVKLGAVADNFVKSGGTISSATDSMTNTLKDLEDQYEATSNRIDIKMETYRSEEHTSELQSLMRITYAVLCLKKKTKIKYNNL